MIQAAIWRKKWPGRGHRRGKGPEAGTRLAFSRNHKEASVRLASVRLEWDWAHRVGDKLREERGGRWANDAAL